MSTLKCCMPKNYIVMEQTTLGMLYYTEIATGSLFVWDAVLLDRQEAQNLIRGKGLNWFMAKVNPQVLRQHKALGSPFDGPIQVER